MLIVNSYMQTAALDGETDLKTRVIPSACVGIDLELLHKMKVRLFVYNHVVPGFPCYFLILISGFYIKLSMFSGCD